MAERPRGETDLCRGRLLKYCKGQGLDLGCGNVKIKPDAIAIDLYSPIADMNRDARDLSYYKNDFFDYVYSSHLLEEIENTEATVREWLRVIKPGGYLVLYQADKDLYYPMGDPQCNRAHKHHFGWEDLWAIIEKIGGVELEHHARYAEEPYKEWSFELVVRKINTDMPEIIVQNKPTIMFRVMIVGGPAEEYIDKCLNSLMEQDYTNWTAQIVLDPYPVGNKTYEKALRYQSDKIKIKLNETRNYPLPNQLEAVRLMNPQDDDVLVTLDADDWFAGPNTLSIAKSYYEANSDLLVTHGSWRAYPNEYAPHNNRPYTEDEFKNGIRKSIWHASHLRTCRYKVWKNVKDEDLRDVGGNYYTTAGDVAITLPMLEMAGFKRVKFIPEILYIYNQETAFNDEKLVLSQQRSNHNYASSKPPYQYRDTF